MQTILSTAFLIFWATFSSAQIHVGNIFLRTQTQVDSFPISFPGISTVFGFVRIGRGPNDSMSDIVDLSPLVSLEHVDLLHIARNPLLPSLNGLENIDTVGTIHIQENDLLKNLSGLEGIRYAFYDGVIIQKNAQLENLQGLNNLTFTWGLTVKQNPSLLSLAGLDNLLYLSETYIYENEALATLFGMIKINHMGIFEVSNNPNLLHFGAFPNLIGGGSADLRVRNNENLIDFAAFEALPQASFGAIEISSNPNLTSLKGFEKLTAISQLRIQGNTKLQHLTDLKSLTKNKDWIQISGSGIDSIQFEGLEYTKGISIFDCPNLKHLVNMTPDLDSCIY